MAVRYIRVNPVANLFVPAVRAFGNIAVVGAVTEPLPSGTTVPPVDTPFDFTDPGDALATFPGPLGTAIATAFRQTPGPTLVYGVRVAAASPDWATALTAVETLDVQFVVLAATPLNAATGDATTTPPGAIVQLATHVTTVSNTGGDGKERMGVAMLEKDVTNTAIVTEDLVNERMVYVAHRSNKPNQDVAAAVAGTIAGYEPHVSVLLKQVNVSTDFFTPTQIAEINEVENFADPPKGKGVIWLTDPVLIPGRGVYLGEAYTGNPGGKKFIDIVRTIDDVSFRLKARLIQSIGVLRISRSGLRSLVAQMEAVLDPLVRGEVIEDYEIVIPILILLDKDPATLTDTELAQINDAQSSRVVEVLVAVDYAGAIHRLAITLRFE
jgi:hypothetical protein